MKQEDQKIFNLEQEKIKNEAIAYLKKTCQSNIATVYKLGKFIILFYDLIALKSFIVGYQCLYQ